jgi:hypothetical protein
MPQLDFFSPAQCVGYAAFVLGVTAFLQKVDRRLKFFNSLESLAYAIHFLLLGNPSAVVSSGVSSVRSLIAIRVRSRLLAAFFIVLNLALGLYVMKTPLGLLPVVGSCFATWAAFTMEGIPMRFVFLFSTFCWLANNILSASIGGTVLESFIASASIVTIARMIADRRRAKRYESRGAA